MNGSIASARRVAAILIATLASLGCGAEPSPPGSTTRLSDRGVSDRGVSDPSFSASDNETRATERTAPRLSTRERLSREPANLVIEELPSGATKLGLRGRLQQAAVARIGPSGKLERGCVDSPEALDHWLKPTNASAAPPKKSAGTP
jgi:hypothetical protein